MGQPLLIAVMGQTASGKTALAECLADHLGASLVNADTFQAYRGMDIGTAKPQRKAEYHLIDIKNPNESFGVGEWVRLAGAALKEAYALSQSVVVVGGSGLNVRALFEGYAEMADAPEQDLRDSLNAEMVQYGLGSLVNRLQQMDADAHAKTDLKNPMRVIRALERAIAPSFTPVTPIPPFRKIKLALQRPADGLNATIEARAREMASNGWLEEVAALRNAGYLSSAPAFRAHGYREMWRVLDGEIGLTEALDSIVAQVRRYAKRQRTWLRKEPRLKVLEACPEGELLERAVAELFVSEEGVARDGEDH